MDKTESTTKKNRSGGSFCRMPQNFATDPGLRKIRGNARVLYALLLDRVSLSRKNGWTEEETGRVFIYYRIKDLAEELCCSERTVIRLMKVLESCGLITRRHLGLGKPDRIFVTDITAKAAPEKAENSCPETTEMSCLEMTETSRPERMEMSRQDRTKAARTEMTNFHPNHTKYNKNYLNHTECNGKRRKESSLSPAPRDTPEGMSEITKLRKLRERILASG